MCVPERIKRRDTEREKGQDHIRWVEKLRAISKKKKKKKKRKVHPQKMTSGENEITFPLFMVSTMRYYQLGKGIRRGK